MDATAVAVLFTNGSSGSELALEFACGLLPSFEWPVRLVGIQERDAEPGQEVLAQLASAAGRLREAGVEVETQIIKGSAPDIIVQESRLAPLAVFGPLGRSGWRRLLHGPTVRRVLQSIDAPALYVRGLPQHPVVRHVLICSGGLGYEEGALRLAGQLAAGLHAEVTLLHISVPFPALPAPVRDVAASEEAYLQMDTIYARSLRKDLEILRSLGLKPVFRLRRGDPLTEIASEMASAPYDLVAIGSHTVVGPLARLVGDITHHIAERARRPVLVVKGHAPPEAV